MRATNSVGNASKSLSIVISSSNVPLTGGTIEVYNEMYGDEWFGPTMDVGGEDAFYIADLGWGFGDGVFIRFVPEPSNATITNILWESNLLGDAIIDPTSIESPIGDYYVKYSHDYFLKVTINNIHEFQVGIFMDPDKN
jgi:hypothetical protein